MPPASIWPARYELGEDATRAGPGADQRAHRRFQEIGINSVRLPFSNEVPHDQRPVTDAAVVANPHLRGRPPLEVYDAVVAALTGAGLAVILDPDG